jgi:signal transduction histidine kinase
MLGYEEHELIGAEVGSLCHPDDRARVAALRETLPPEGKGEVEVRALRKDGVLIYTRGLLVRAKDKGAGFHVFLRDITEEKTLRDQLVLADRMASMGTLAAGVAHEINNPLSFVIANASVLSEMLPQIAESIGAHRHDELTEIIGDIRDGSERVRKIVRDLKMFSRPDDTTRGPVDVHRVLESSLNMAWNEIRHRARLVKDFGQTTMVDANDGQLGQVFLNLLVNAAHAIPEGAVEANEIRIRTALDEDDRLVVEVRDTGSGMTPDVLTRIFDPFYTTKPVGMGTGLGLSVCHGLVAKNGGEITVESEPGVGSVFRVFLNRAKERMKSDAPPRPPVLPALPRRRVLVVDDEPMIATSLRRVLAKHYEVAACTGGAEALALLTSKHDFQLILCDIMMPDVSGIDVYEELLRTAPDTARRMVFMTGGAFTPRAKAFLDHVPNHRLEKPIDVPALLTWLRETLPST